jgi:hypothetical protein
MQKSFHGFQNYTRLIDAIYFTTKNLNVPFGIKKQDLRKPRFSRIRWLEEIGTCLALDFVEQTESREFLG